MNIEALDMNALGNAGAWIDITDPAGRETDAKVLIRGAQSDEVRAVAQRHSQRVAAAIKAAGDKPVDYEALGKQQEAEMAVAAVLDWKGFERNGAELPCTPENIRSLFLHPGYAWLATQVYADAQEARVFLKP